MNRDKATQTIAKAVETAHLAYWSVCVAEERAIDPQVLGATESFLDNAQANALLVEYLAQERGLTWAEALELIRASCPQSFLLPTVFK